MSKIGAGVNSSKGPSSMQVQMRKRVVLLSRASTLAIVAAAAGGLGSVQQAEAAACATSQNISGVGNATVSSPVECVSTNNVTGNVTVNAQVGDPGVGYPSFFVGKGGISGELDNNSLIVGGHTSAGSSTYGALTIAADIAGGLRNDGQITSATGNAVQIGFTNSGTIASAPTLSGDITNNSGIAGGLGGAGITALAGNMTGELINNSNGVITGGTAGVYIADSFSSWSGGISNYGSIHSNGNNGGIQIGTVGSTNVDFDGGIYNTGEISSVNGPGVFASGNSYGGGLTNYGLITETGNSWAGQYGGSGVVLDAQDVSGDINNYGTIEGNFRDALRVTSNVNLFDGSITNTNLIDGAEGGVTVRAFEVNGNFNNSGRIFGGYTGVAYSNVYLYGTGGEGSTATFTNSGSIIGGSYGLSIWASTVEADVSTGGGEGSGLISGGGEGAGIGVLLGAYSWTGDITNTGTITGGQIGLALDYNPFLYKAVPGSEFTGNFQNTGSITGGNTGVLVNAYNYTGNFTNDGTIVGTDYGARIVGASSSSVGSLLAALSLGGGTFDGVITNNGVMSGQTALFVSFDTVTGGVDNSGTLLGATRGLYIDVNDFQGDINNSGTIIASGAETIGSYATAIQIGDPELQEGGFPYSEETVTGNIDNSGTAHGADTGLSIVLDSYFAGKGGEGFTNSGSILGDDWTGMYVNVNTWDANWTNEAGGYIEGGVDGVVINAGTITGDFSNFGTIVGHEFDTGWSINTPSFTGNIVNGPAGVITAPSNALHLKINNFSGSISNAGFIGAPSGNAVVLEGHSGNGTYNGAFTNTGTIAADNIGLRLNGAQLTGGINNNGGTIIAPTAISSVNATGATTVTNQGNGVILGDVRFSQTYGDSFIGMNGGIVGDIIGAGGEGGEGGGGAADTVLVHNGTHYFSGKGNQATTLSSFTVGKNGMAVVGALFEGDTNGTGYSINNVDLVNVQSGGILYIDKSTTINATNYTQASGGTVEYYLGAPAGISGLTGDVTAAAGDYGVIHTSGSAVLAGTIAGYLDPDFGNANSGLNSVTYNDVLIADGGITGDFSTLALISNNTIFELDEIIDGNTVDLTVLRAGSAAPLADVGSIVITLGGPWKNVVTDASSGIGSGGCGIAGPGWCFNSYAANEAGGSAVMTDASLDPFQWLRGGQRRVGDTNVWGRAVGVWGDTDGDNTGHTGTDFDTFGGIVGVDHVFTPTFMAGVAAQYTQTDIDFKQLADNADVNSFEIGAYMSYGDARFYINANSSVIFHSIEVERFALGGTANGDYDGTTYSAYGEIGRIFETEGGAVRIQPLAALSYAHLDTDSYNETGSATTLLHVFDADLDSLKSMLGGRFGFPIEMDSGRKFVPEARIIWAHEFMDDHASFLANPISNPLSVAQINGERFSRDSLILGTGATLPLSNSTSLFFDYDATLNSDVTTHTVSGGFRSRF